MEYWGVLVMNCLLTVSCYCEVCLNEVIHLSQFGMKMSWVWMESKAVIWENLPSDKTGKAPRPGRWYWNWVWVPERAHWWRDHLLPSTDTLICFLVKIVLVRWLSRSAGSSRQKWWVRSLVAKRALQFVNVLSYCSWNSVSNGAARQLLLVMRAGIDMMVIYSFR